MQDADLVGKIRRAAFKYNVFARDAYPGRRRVVIEDGASRTQPQHEELDFPDAAEQAK